MERVQLNSVGIFIAEVPKSFSIWVRYIEKSQNEIAKQVIHLLELWDVGEALEIYKKQEHTGIILN